MSRRPDVRMAEMALASAFYDVNQAKAALYPSLTLSATGTFTNGQQANINPGAIIGQALAGLAQPIFQNGRLVYQDPTLEEKRAYCDQEMNALYPEVRRIEKPHKYIVDLSNELRELRDELIRRVNQQTKTKQKTIGSK